MCDAVGACDHSEIGHGHLLCVHLGLCTAGGLLEHRSDAISNDPHITLGTLHQRCMLRCECCTHRIKAVEIKATHDVARSCECIHGQCVVIVSGPGARHGARDGRGKLIGAVHENHPGGGEMPYRMTPGGHISDGLCTDTAGGRYQWAITAP